MRIANAPCSWGIFYADDPRVSPEDYLDQLTAAGYRGTELGPLGFLPVEAPALEDLLGPRDLSLVGATHVHTFGDPASAPKLMADLRRIGGLMRSFGAEHVVVMDESNFYPKQALGQMDAVQWRAMCRALNEAQRMLEGDFGLYLSFHPHIGTAVELETQIEKLLEDTMLDLCFDTGHHAYWGQDVLAFLDRHWARIAYMHLKNVDGALRARALAGDLSVPDAMEAGIMCALPDGVVPVDQVMARLRDGHFTGPIVVEQDFVEGAAESPMDLSKRNLAYLGELS